MDKVSYALGLSIGNNFQNSGIKDLQVEDFVQGLNDVLTEAKPALSYDEAKQVINDYFMKATFLDDDGNEIPKTVISREYSSEWKLGDEPYYPVNDAKNGALYEKYKELAKKEEKVIFGGRLGEYKYYDMDAVIASALELVKKEL